MVKPLILMIQPEAFQASISKLAQQRGFEILSAQDDDSTKLVVLFRKAPCPNPFRLYLSAGIHGDEPAGPLTVENLIAHDSLPYDIEIVICPLINPSGIAAGTRENSLGYDLNRDFRHPLSPESRAIKNFLSDQSPFDLSICLHEDWESSGFYLYAISPDDDQKIPRAILDAVQSVGPLDLSSEIDGNPSHEGLIQRIEEFDPDSREDWPEAFYLYSRFQHTHFTTESPSSAPIELRVEMQKTAILTAIKLVRQKKKDEASAE